MTKFNFELIEEEKKSLLDRFVRYCKVNTRSSDTSETFPSTKEQWDLLNILRKELEEMGLEEITLDEKGYLFASLPATKGYENAPVIGFLAHVDTYPGTSADNVSPKIIEKYDGKPIILNGGDVVIDQNDSPHLSQMFGHTLITTDGKTLLGADDKAGIASIMEMVSYFIKHPEIPHGKIRVGFTPDEETGRGADYFDVKAFGADAAYTVDGSIIGEIETETFCGDSATVEVIGYDIHPGLAKNKMKNAVRAAADFIRRLPEDNLPETTEKRESYLHPIAISGEVGKVVVKFIVRAFNVEELREREEDIKRVAQETEKDWEGVVFNVNIEEGYRNMKVILDQYPKVVNLAKEAVKLAGIEPFEGYIRGGTDGCRLSFMGLPTPNIFNGALSFHGVKEHISLE
ncbi:MAG: peptidase T, partial [Acidobacteria bacterium]|nr:peptidase T [Acidobacteriota bacterium]